MAWIPPRVAAAGLTYCPQERPVFDDLSVRENLDPDANEPAARRRFGPGSPASRFSSAASTQHAGTLSGGEKKILSFVRGLAEDQPVVLLDEPSEGVQWENIQHMVAGITEKKAAGTAFVVVEQNLAFAEQIADHYLVMDQGRAMLEGSSSIIDRSQILAHLHV